MLDPQVVQKLQRLAFDVVNDTPEALAARVHQDAKVMADLLQRKVVTPD